MWCDFVYTRTCVVVVAWTNACHTHLVNASYNTVACCICMRTLLGRACRCRNQSGLLFSKGKQAQAIEGAHTAAQSLAAAAFVCGGPPYHCVCADRARDFLRLHRGSTTINEYQQDRPYRSHRHTLTAAAAAAFEARRLRAKYISNEFICLEIERETELTRL